MNIQKIQRRMPEGKLCVFYREKNMPARKGFFVWGYADTMEEAMNSAKERNGLDKGKRLYYIIDKDKQVRLPVDFEGKDIKGDDITGKLEEEI